MHYITLLLGSIGGLSIGSLLAFRFLRRRPKTVDDLPTGLTIVPGYQIWKSPLPPEDGLLQILFAFDDLPKGTDNTITFEMAAMVTRENVEEMLNAARHAPKDADILIPVEVEQDWN